ncbi:hypothetical protein AB0J21_17405 [Streptomyces sp. NPDC049954]|uniref:hypothetical protein n=1 Tax=Streptomyces sp. NPDC049954 TaxID=3155779 RepID=UPI003426BA48
MPVWQPEPGETLLARNPCFFASGLAPTLRGKRWFRDPEGRDIQSELTEQAGWPEAPTMEPLDPGEAKKNGFVRGLGTAAFGAIGLAVGVLGGNLPGDSGGGKGGRVTDRPNEIDDFPVLCGAPGTLARTLPWQLDPGRQPEDYTTHLAVTDRRLLVLGLPGKDAERDEVLWQAEREVIASATRMPYSPTRHDLKLVFSDGSWCRLVGTSAFWPGSNQIRQPPDIIPEGDYTPALRKAIAEVQRTFPDREVLFVQRRRSGNYVIRGRHPHDKPSANSGLFLHPAIVNESGRRVRMPSDDDI